MAALCGVVHPPRLLMNGLNLYGTKGTIVDGRVRLEPEGIVPVPRVRRHLPGDAARPRYRDDRHDRSHGRLRGQRRPTPWVGVREGARVVATGLACWESMRTGQPAKVRNDF